MIAGVLNALIGVFSSYTMQYVTEIVANGKKDRIKEMFLMVIILAVGLALIYLFYMYAKNKFSMKVICDIRQDLFQSILNRDMTGYYKQNTSYYTSLYHNDLQVVETTLLAYFILVVQLEEIVFSLAYAFVQNVVLCILLIVVGIVGLAVFFPRSMVIASYAFTLLEYLVIMMISFERPSRWRNIDEIGIIGTTLGSFIIVALSVFTMIFVLLKRYEEQRKQLLTLSENLEFAANHDPLTRLYNRRYLVNQVNEWICKPEKSFWIVLMDVDEFKAVNDTYGHDAGDEVLKAVAGLFMDKMKPYGRVCRWGGEEFLFVFYGRNGDAAYDALQEIYDEIHRLTVSYENEEIRITVTFGLEEYDKNDGMEMAIRRADEKLYQGKETGRDKIVY